EQVKVISDLLNRVEETGNYFSSYRWDYGDMAELIGRKRDFITAAGPLVDRIEDWKDMCTDGEYVLSEAVITVYGTFSGYLEEIAELLLSGRSADARSVYYDMAAGCCEYLGKYSRSLLEEFIGESGRLYTELSITDLKLGRLQNIILVLMILSGCFLVHDLVRTIKALLVFTRAAEAIGRGDLDYPDVSVVGSGEIQNLTVVFNDMKNSMKSTVEVLEEKNRMEAELHRRETEALELESLLEREQLQQLRSQINPHFLFNTLNMVVYSAGQEGAEKTRRLLGALSNLFRYSLASNDFYAPLSREIRIVNEFYLLYHERFGDRILLKWQVDRDIDVTETLIPSFILQPLCENSFKHGLLPLEDGGTVTVSVHRDGLLLRFTVEDDGAGMDGKTLADLLERMKSRSLSGEHLGLYNVDARLRLSGNGFLSVRSEKGKGTVVEFSVVEKREAEDDDQDCDC
ncbi:MAG: sensor histidine kinase, partial [Bullifex sp.]